MGLDGAGSASEDAGTDPSGAYVDLRGLSCELKEGKEVCFRVGASGEREICPEYVTSAYLTSGADQWVCNPTTGDPKLFCTAACQTGNERVFWGAHEHQWCREHEGQCPAAPRKIPQSEFKLEEWSESARPRPACASRKARKNVLLPPVTFGILTHSSQELRTFRDTLATYEEEGMLDAAREVVVYINKRSADVDAVLAEYKERMGDRLVVLGDTANHGITRALTWMSGNATQPYLLLLEKDFQLVEPLECVREQLEAGVALLKKGKAHVVRYRSRDRPGNPNWAEYMFKGDEERVFKQQPNLLCNHYYWVRDPDKRWPTHFERCAEEPSVFYCSGSKYCNWTNNPSLFATAWWKKAYVDDLFTRWTRMDPWEHLEMYMNWEPEGWNEAGWVVAQGDGLFKHVDRNNFA